MNIIDYTEIEADTLLPPAPSLLHLDIVYVDKDSVRA